MILCQTADEGIDLINVSVSCLEPCDGDWIAADFGETGYGSETEFDARLIVAGEPQVASALDRKTRQIESAATGRP